MLLLGKRFCRDAYKSSNKNIIINCFILGTTGKIITPKALENNNKLGV